MTYLAASDRYDDMIFRRSGRSGLKLPLLSLGSSGRTSATTGRSTVSGPWCVAAFDLGITHFDLANNYGPPYGAAESNFGTAATDLAPYRDELVISTKAGWDMWPGPYGVGGSRKYLLASLDRSLERLGLDYVDIFYPTAPTPRPRSTRRSARTTPCAPAGRATSASRRTRPRRAARSPAARPARHADADPPAVVLDAEPLDRDRGAPSTPPVSSGSA